MRNVRAWTSRLLVLLLIPLAGALFQPSAANAGTCTTGVGCGIVDNRSPYSIIVSNNWCWDNAPRYGVNPMLPVCGDTLQYLSPGHRSDEYITDTDAFRSDVGCVTYYTPIHYPAFPTPTSAFQHTGYQRVDDRRGKSNAKWMKLTDDEIIRVDGQSCGTALPTKHYVTTWAAASGFQDQWCATDGTGADWGGGPRCASDGVLYAASNYFYCKISGGRVNGSNGTYNDWWLMTDLDTVNSGRDGRSFVSAYYLSGGYNDSQNNRAVYWNGSAWVDFPNC